MGLTEIERPKPPPRTVETQFQQVARPRLDEVVSLKRVQRGPALSPVQGRKLRCVEVTPRHLELIGLEAGDCRYPYGGDEEGEAITFCGRPRRMGSSYCTPHFHLTRDPDVPTERTPSVAPLRLIATV